MDRNLIRDTLLTIAVNALPLLGVLFAGWDVFTVLILYWLETAIIGFWVCIRLLTGPADTLAGLNRGTGKPVGRPGLAGFLVANASIFMGIHLLFLWTLFSDDWSDRVHGPAVFVSLIIIGTGIWMTLIALFLLRGLEALAAIRTEVPAQPAVAGFYVRIFVMQFTILGGAWLAIAIGSAGGLVVLVAVKTAVDLALSPLPGRIQGAIRDAVAARRGSP